MPRKETMAIQTNRWIRTNREWLQTAGHMPLAQQLKMLAAAMDNEFAATGLVKSATASAYRLTFVALNRMQATDDEDDDLLPAVPPTTPDEDDDPDGLFAPR